MKKDYFLLFRFFICAVIFFLALAAILFRAVFLASDPYDLRKKQNNITHKSIVNKAPRGEFVDRHGYPLAMNIPRYRLYLDLKNVNYQDKDFRILQTILPLDEKIQSRISKLKTGQYGVLGLVDHETKLRIKDSKLPGLQFEELSTRYYPLGKSLSPVIGRVDNEGYGQDGLEKFYDIYLSGSDGIEFFKQNRLGQAIDKSEIRKKMNQGGGLAITIDHRVQQFAYSALVKSLEKCGAVSGAVVVLNQDGEIIAMANAPSYDPNDSIVSVDDRMKNRSIIDVFEPGSTIKPFAFVGILPHISLNTVIDTEGGLYRLGRFVIKDVKKNLGVLTLSEALAASSNVAMLKLAKMAGGDVLIKTYMRFKLFEPSYAGFLGEKTNLRLTGIKPGSIDYYALSYGYGFEVNLLQLAHAYLILSNRGLDPGIHLLMKKELKRPKSIQMFDHNVIDKVVSMMNNVVDSGTGSAAKIKGYSVAGKTGTTKIAVNGSYDSDQYIASFAGFAPSDKTDGHRYVVAVVIFKPNVAMRFGGLTAAPLFADIMSYVLSLGESV